MPLLVGWRAKLLLDGNHWASLGCSSSLLRRWAPNGVASLVEGLLNAAGYDTRWRRGHGDVTAGYRHHDHMISPFRGSAKTSRRSPHGLTTTPFSGFCIVRYKTPLAVRPRIDSLSFGYAGQDRCVSVHAWPLIERQIL